MRPGVSANVSGSGRSAHSSCRSDCGFGFQSQKRISDLTAAYPRQTVDVDDDDVAVAAAVVVVVVAAD